MSTYTVCLDAQHDLWEGGFHPTRNMIEQFEARYIAEAELLAAERKATVNVLRPGDNDYMGAEMSDSDREFWQAVHSRIKAAEIEAMR